MLLALLSLNGKIMHKKTVTGNHEELIDRARDLLQSMDEQDAMWETFDSMVPDESWVPSAEEKWLIDKIAQVLKELA